MNTKKKILFGIGAVTALVAIYFIYEYFMYVTTDNAQIQAHTVMLAPKVPGYVVDVKVQEGDFVKKGSLLLSIDDRDYTNTLHKMQNDLGSMQARRKDAESNHHRLQSLYSKGAVSQQQYETALAGYTELKSKYEAISAQVSQAELNLQYTKIVAPSDGFIAKKNVEPGQFASPGVPVIGFVDAGERWVVANFKETQIQNIKIGSLVDIDLDAYPSKDFTGKVVSLSSATGATFTLLPPDNATGNFTKVVQRIPVKISIENFKPEDIEFLKAGLSVDVKVHRR